MWNFSLMIRQGLFEKLCFKIKTINDSEMSAVNNLKFLNEIQDAFDNSNCNS